jgi:hypothetical protein
VLGHRRAPSRYKWRNPEIGCQLSRFVPLIRPLSPLSHIISTGIRSALGPSRCGKNPPKLHNWGCVNNKSRYYSPVARLREQSAACRNGSICICRPFIPENNVQVAAQVQSILRVFEKPADTRGLLDRERIHVGEIRNRQVT